MTKVDNMSAAACDADTYAIDAAEAAFILTAQSEIQKILNRKGLRARDLAKRLGVSEARVSQMFGDAATNLTLRTVARIFHHLGETALLTTEEDFERRLAEARGTQIEEDDRWTVTGLARDLQMASNTNRVDAETSVSAPPSRRTFGMWARAEEAHAVKLRATVR